MRLRLAGLFLLALFFAVVVSCQAPLQVAISPDLAELVPLVNEALGSGRVALEDPTRGEPNTLRLTTTPGWNLPAGSADAGVLSDWPELSQVWPLPVGLALLGRNVQGWTAVPVLYDLWGVTTFVDQTPEAVPAWQSWESLMASPVPVRIAGGAPSFRQAAFLFQNRAPATAPVDATRWFGQARDPWVASLQTLPAFVMAPRWEANAWAMSRPDLEFGYQAGTPHQFIETYRTYELANPNGIRQFVPLASGDPSRPAFVGIVVFLEFRGTDLAGAHELITKLLSSSFAKRAGQKFKWLAASPAAPEIDGTGAGVRQLLYRPATVFPVTDRLPTPIDPKSLFGAIEEMIETSPKR